MSQAPSSQLVACADNFIYSYSNSKDHVENKIRGHHLPVLVEVTSQYIIKL